MKNEKKRVGILAAIVVAVAVLMGVVYLATAPKGVAGDKTLSVEVVFADKTQKDYTLNTNQEFLRGALEEAKLVSGTEGEYGLFVTAVAGVQADSTKQEWWCFTRGGETLTDGVDTIPVKDGDHFEIVLTTGYDIAE